MINALIVVVSYLIGSISPGVILGKTLKGIDIRNYGSGNTGATNVLRILGPTAAGLAFIVDCLKGAFAVWLGSFGSYENLPYICGAAAIIGHNWPIFVGFRGGKGVATAAGIVFSLMPLTGLVLLGVWLVVVLLTRYVSLSSIIAAVSVIPALFVQRSSVAQLIFGVFLAALIVSRHRPNIKRLLEGKESKIGQRVKTDGRG